MKGKSLESFEIFVEHDSMVNIIKEDQSFIGPKEITRIPFSKQNYGRKYLQKHAPGVGTDPFHRTASYILDAQFLSLN